MGENERRPGLKNDAGKLRMDLVPWVAIDQLAAVLSFGAEKYKEDSWQKVDGFYHRYFAALMRHLDAWWYRDEQIDPESGLHHLSHALCCLTFLLWGIQDYQNLPRWEDDSVQEKVAEVLAKKVAKKAAEIEGDVWKQTLEIVTDRKHKVGRPPDSDESYCSQCEIYYTGETCPQAMGSH